MERFEIVKFEESKHLDLVEPLTEMLHQAYRPLAEKGMRYLATHQPPEMTLKRLRKGAAFLGFVGGELAATITVVRGDFGETCPWYQKPEVFFFTQFAVRPKYQGLGLGRKLMDFVEEYGVREGAQEMALDTSEHADHLISIYKNRGYRFVEHVRWDSVNYRSVVLSKVLAQSTP